MASIKLFATDEQVNEHPFVWVDPGTDSEKYWRSKGYISEAEAKAKAEEAEKAAAEEPAGESAADGEAAEGGMRRRGRPRGE